MQPSDRICVLRVEAEVMQVLPDPCPLPDTVKKKGLSDKEKLLYAPMADVGGMLYDKDAVYIDLPQQTFTKQVRLLASAMVGWRVRWRELRADCAETHGPYFAMPQRTQLHFLSGSACAPKRPAGVYRSTAQGPYHQLPNESFY